MRGRRSKRFQTVLVGSPVSVNGQVTTVVNDSRIEAGDHAIFVPKEATAAALVGAAASVYVTVAAGAVTLHHGAAAGTETWDIFITDQK